MDSTTSLLLSIHLAATAAMVGLIWFVQLVHYPLFARVGAAEFVDYEAAHTRLTAYVVGPAMAVEGVAALIIAGWFRAQAGLGLTLAGLVLLALVHVSTVSLQVPAHRRLASGFDDAVAKRLVRSNWIRTAGWTARGGVGVAMLTVAT